MAGWLTMLEVHAAPCELVAPTIAGLNFPENAQYVPGPYTISADITDNVAVDSAKVFYRVNNGPWVDTVMVNTSGTTWDVTIPDTAIAVGDTVEYYLMAWDVSCPNSIREPQLSNYRFWRDDAPPAYCGSVIAGNPPIFPLIIQSFPWQEDFESSGWVVGTGSGTFGTTHRGGIADYWTWSPDENTTGYAWSVRSGSTGSFPTSGPDGDHTTGGGQYVFTEADQTGTNSQLVTPCIDLTSLIAPKMSFWFHMYGSDIGTLRVDVLDSAGASMGTPYTWSNNVNRIDGQQQNSSAAAWQKAEFALKPANDTAFSMVL